MARSPQTNEGGEKKPVSLTDIAATLISASPVQEVEEDPTGGDNEVEAEEVVDEIEGGEEEPPVEEGETQEEEQPEDELTEQLEFLDINDDDVLTVVVDGEEREVTIGELKKAHSLGGATEKRLQEATEMRKAAHAERTQMLEKLAEQERTLTEALSSLDDKVFQPVIPEPPPQLRRTNPEQYLRHKDAYDADQRRIAEAKQAVQEKLTALQQQRRERLNEYAQHAGRIIVQEIPELADEKKSAAMLQRLAETAKVYGYTDQEIQSALDPRMFLLVRDAMRYRDMMDKSKERRDPTNLEGQQAKKVRRLRTGNTTAKQRARSADKQRKAVVERARSTGKVSDVAATLIVPKG